MKKQHDLVSIVNKQLKAYFTKGTTFIVAVSGGVDSMTLLDVLSKISDYHYVVISLDHSIRKNSSADVKLVKKLAKEYKLECHSQSLPVPTVAKEKRKGLEEAARDLRYKALQKFRKQYKALAIITAHHQDDQNETILFHLIRGSDLHGLIGMETVNRQHIFRPLLGITKAQIKIHANQHKLEWHEDSTNTDTQLSRNAIRHNLAHNFPPELLTKVSQQAAATTQVFNQFIVAWLNSHLKPIRKSFYFERRDFLALPLYLQFYLLQHLTKDWFHLRDFSFSWLSSIYQWIVYSHSKSKYVHLKRTILLNQNGRIVLITQS